MDNGETQSETPRHYSGLGEDTNVEARFPGSVDSWRLMLEMARSKITAEMCHTAPTLCFLSPLLAGLGWAGLGWAGLGCVINLVSPTLSKLYNS